MSSKGRKLNALEQRIHQAALAATDMVCVVFVCFFCFCFLFSFFFFFCCDCYAYYDCYACFVFPCSCNVCGGVQRDLGRGRRKITELPTDFLAYHPPPPLPLSLSLILTSLFTRLFTYIPIWLSGYLICSTYFLTYLFVLHVLTDFLIYLYIYLFTWISSSASSTSVRHFFHAMVCSFSWNCVWCIWTRTRTPRPHLHT